MPKLSQRTLVPPISFDYYSPQFPKTPFRAGNNYSIEENFDLFNDEDNSLHNFSFYGTSDSQRETIISNIQRKSLSKAVYRVQREDEITKTSFNGESRILSLKAIRPTTDEVINRTENSSAELSLDQFLTFGIPASQKSLGVTDDTRGPEIVAPTFVLYLASEASD